MFPRTKVRGRPAPLLHHVQVDEHGYRSAVTEWRPEGRAAATAVFVHATGFHSRCWDQVIQHLPSVHCFCVDLRGHGQSDKPKPQCGFYAWSLLAEDLATVLQHFRIGNAIGIGHSCGGWVVAHAAHSDVMLFSALLLVDPVIFPAQMYKEWQPPANPNPMEGRFPFVARRRNEFTSAQEMYDRLKEKGSYKSWRAECLADYCAFGLLPASQISSSTAWCDSSVAHNSNVGDPACLVLACPPWAEVATYGGSASHSDRERYQDITIPVTILRGQRRPASSGDQPDFNNSPTDPDLWKLFASKELIRDISLPMTHFIPMQSPEVVVQHLVNLATRAGIQDVFSMLLNSHL